MDLLEKPKQFPTVKQMSEAALPVLRDMKPSDVITYETLSQTIGWDSRSTRGRSAVLRACRRLQPERNYLFINVRDVGYQLALPNQHQRESMRLQAGSRRRLVRGLQAVVFCALDAMTPDEANRTLIEQVRCRLKLGLDRKLSKAKGLTPKAQVALPSGAKLIEMFTREAKSG